MTDLHLRLHIDDSPDTTVVVAQNEFIIGRLPECDLCLPFSEISRYHARITRTTADHWILEDLGSTNGTVLNRNRMAKAHIINHGDVIQMGNVFLFVLFPRQQEENAPLPLTEIRTIQRNAAELQQQWIGAHPQDNEKDDADKNKEKAIARLEYLVKIAQGLNSAASIEDIFKQVQDVVFQDLKNIERLALLVDVEGKGELEILRRAFRHSMADLAALNDSSNWISFSICQTAFQEKVAIKTLDAQSDERFATEDSILVNEIHGALAVPLWDEKQVMGVLYADAHYSWTVSELKIDEDDLSFFSTLANLVGSSLQRWLLTRKLEGEARLRNQLERYHSPAMVQQLLNVGALENGRIKPKEEDISILFADLVGFTALSEDLTPAQVADLLNRFFDEMIKPVFQFGGTLDKYIGDCIMAFFGAPEPQADHADRAVNAALEMLNRLGKLNAANTWDTPLQLHIAINSGKAFVGDVGGSQRVDYTVLGGAVNLASRLEEICPAGECVISEETYRRLKNTQDFQKMEQRKFKGIDRPIQVYRTTRT